MPSGASAAFTFSALADTDKKSVKLNTSPKVYFITVKANLCLAVLIQSCTLMTCQMLLTNRVPCKGKAVIKRALLVTDRIPDKKGLPSQVYRSQKYPAPGAIFLWLLILHLLH